MRIYLLALCCILLSCQTKTYNVGKIDTKQVEIDSTFDKPNEIEEFVKPYREKINNEMNKVLAYSPKAMFKSEANLNTSIGNLMADAVLELAKPIFNQRENLKIDAVLLNYGGIRGGINKGEVTTRTAYNIMPFENEIVVAKLDSVRFKQLINYLVEAKRAHPIAGLKLNLKANGQIQSVEVNGKPLDQAFYYVATSDYLVKGGDHMSFFTKADTTYNLNYKLRSLLIDYFEQQDTLSSKVDSRFTQLYPKP
ncbi:5'-nucleotidase C-terminal domain-containing protein [Psychroflexus sp. ALD_RP9]|uniref:5'-nucleotidase C-terminal domain-containing protein n=1 Tax=Psychroflexus sp. ALD_RP9 TaxID=2777186 RepID=UPI001A8C9BD5|nr:5'-nucleotidase C-terminal domain-containing protein [Psychroflexus sp. ALD_RP9]QSS96919.1 5'-nucleotidase C-terminal domain-containing protein [Psychroflexus sp. ALD_RP9]